MTMHLPALARISLACLYMGCIYLHKIYSIDPIIKTSSGSQKVQGSVCKVLTLLSFVTDHSTTLPLGKKGEGIARASSSQCVPPWHLRGAQGYSLVLPLLLMFDFAQFLTLYPSLVFPSTCAAFTVPRPFCPLNTKSSAWLLCLQRLPTQSNNLEYCDKKERKYTKRVMVKTKPKQQRCTGVGNGAAQTFILLRYTIYLKAWESCYKEMCLFGQILRGSSSFSLSVQGI